MRGSSTDRGPPMAQVCPPQLWGHFHLSACDSVSVCDSAMQPIPGDQVFLMSVCAKTPALLPPSGHRRVQVPPKQTFFTDARMYANVCVCPENRTALCTRQGFCRLNISKSSFMTMDCQLHLIALDRTGIRFCH